MNITAQLDKPDKRALVQILLFSLLEESCLLVV